MGISNKKRKTLRVLAICVLLPAVLAIIWVRLCDSQGKMEGEWSFFYYYSNDSSLVYKGTAFLQLEDSLSAKFEIYPPKSKRPEMIYAQELKYDSDTGKLHGVLVHDRYKIREGHMLEEFQITFEDHSTFTGMGHCREYCAEGTENAEITWLGTRAISD